MHDAMFSLFLPTVPCANNAGCTNGVCVCNPPYSGIDCCRCSKQQDIYFVVDATLSNNRLPFCQTHYGIELMIAAMSPSTSDQSGTQIGAVLYPKVSSVTEKRVAHNLLDLGTGCSDSILSYNKMIDEFSNYDELPAGPFYDYVRGGLTYPSVAITKLANNIRQSIDLGDPKGRRRIVVIITDGNNDGDAKELQDAVSYLYNMATNMIIIVAGNDNAFRDEPDLAKRFKEELTFIARGDESNVVIEDNSLSLATRLVEKMEAVGALCEDHGKIHVMTVLNPCMHNNTALDYSLLVALMVIEYI